MEAETEWDGELNEIVHHSRRGINGRDILMHIMLSDDIQDDNNKNILFSDRFTYLGIKIGVNSKGDYCIIMDFASQLSDGQAVSSYPEPEQHDTRGKPI